MSFWLLRNSFILLGLFILPASTIAAIVQIDLDRAAPGVQDFLAIPSNSMTTILGAVVVTGISEETAGRHALEIQFENQCFPEPIVDCESSEWRVGEIGEKGGIRISTRCESGAGGGYIRHANLIALESNLGEDGELVLFEFDLVVHSSGENAMEIRMAGDDPQLGILINGTPLAFGPFSNNPSNVISSGAFVQFGENPCTPIPTPTFTPSNTSTATHTRTPTQTPTMTPTFTASNTPTDTHTPTETFTPSNTPTPTDTFTPTHTFTPVPTFTPAPPCADAGLFLLDSLGGRHRVGNPLYLTGPLYYGRPVAKDLENVKQTDAVLPDLAVLDTLGAVQFVENPGSVPPQMFYWPEGSDPACGSAVDLEMTNDSSGFWVLTEGGGIFRAGTALPVGEDPGLGHEAAELCDVLPLPFEGDLFRATGVAADSDATLRAVGFAVIQSEDPANPHGYIILDSQGGHYTFDSLGHPLDDDIPNSVLNAPGGPSETVYPFFKGLDISRDIELHPAGDRMSGLIILDGWGGVHPVPVPFASNNQVSFVRNEFPAQTTTTGLPYLIHAFDDPVTEEDESNTNDHGFDVHSIFLDLEFCSTGDGLYIMDRFGGIFTFGNTRTDPNSTLPRFFGGPYFFPYFLAENLEPETGFAETLFR